VTGKIVSQIEDKKIKKKVDKTTVDVYNIRDSCRF
jgi:hypothetical protein